MDFKQARKILKKYDRRILEKTKYCNGVSIRKENGHWELNVLLTRKRFFHKHLESLNLEGLPVKTKWIGVLRPVQSRTEKWRPAPGGVSIGHYAIAAGTLGCSVFKEDKKYILSNNHVLANENNCNIGDDIYQPGPADGGTVADKIGELYSYITLIWNDPENPNYVDAALCKPTNESDVLDSLIGLDYPKGKREAELGESVTKSGRTTGVTEDNIVEFTGLIAVDYGGGRIGYFDDQILTNYMATHGDSGSLLIDKTDRKAVGLLFAGSSSVVVFNRATKVAEELGIQFYGEEARATLEVKYNIPHIQQTLESKYDIILLVEKILTGKYGIWPPTLISPYKIEIAKSFESVYKITLSPAIEINYNISFFDIITGKYDSLLTKLLHAKYPIIAPEVPKVLESLYDLLLHKDGEVNYDVSFFDTIIGKYAEMLGKEFEAGVWEIISPKIPKTLESFYDFLVAKIVEGNYDVSFFDYVIGKYNSLLTQILNGVYRITPNIVPKVLENLNDIFIQLTKEANYDVSFFDKVIAKYDSLLTKDFKGEYDNLIADILDGVYYINQEQIVDFSFWPTGGTPPVVISFTDLSTGVPEPYFWKWDFGDGSPISNIRHPDHQYTTAEIFTVKSTVTFHPDTKISKEKTVNCLPFRNLADDISLEDLLQRTVKFERVILD